MNIFQSILFYFFRPVISLLIFLIFIEVIFSWLIAFNVINLRNPNMAQIYRMIQMVTNPILAPIRKILPSFGGLDFSPIAALLGLYWLRDWVVPMAMQAVG